MINARIEKQISSLKLSDSSEIKKLLRYAYSRKFLSRVKFNKVYFFPSAKLWNNYLTISVEEKNCKLSFKIKEHNFLKTNKYIDREVSTKWLKGFFDFRAKDAQKDIDDFLENWYLHKKKGKDYGL